jgi:hypothetical protein
VIRAPKRREKEKAEADFASDCNAIAVIGGCRAAQAPAGRSGNVVTTCQHSKNYSAKLDDYTIDG